MPSLIWILLMVGARATAKFTHHVLRRGSRGWRLYTTMPNLQVLRHQTQNDYPYIALTLAPTMRWNAIPLFFPSQLLGDYCITSCLISAPKYG